MSRVRRLASAYARYIEIPWQHAASAQRVVFCIYHEEDELRLRANIGEFEVLTRQAGHDWLLYDVTDSFAAWLTTQRRYATKYFADPAPLVTLMPKYRAYIRDDFARAVQEAGADANTVVAVTGTGALYGFLKVREVVDDMAPLVAGRLLVFFPGTYENSNYRLLDAYDGWNYLAVPITADKE